MAENVFAPGCPHPRREDRRWRREGGGRSPAGLQELIYGYGFQAIRRVREDIGPQNMMAELGQIERQDRFGSQPRSCAGGDARRWHRPRKQEEEEEEEVAKPSRLPGAFHGRPVQDGPGRRVVQRIHCTPAVRLDACKGRRQRILRQNLKESIPRALNMDPESGILVIYARCIPDTGRVGGPYKRPRQNPTGGP